MGINEETEKLHKIMASIRRSRVEMSFHLSLTANLRRLYFDLALHLCEVSCECQACCLFRRHCFECGVELSFYLAYDKSRISISQKYRLRSDFILFPSTTTKS